jgi:hypothetical protein
MHTYAHMHTCTRTHAEICTLMHTDAHMHTYACRHMHTYAHMHTYTCTHMHTYAQCCHIKFFAQCFCPVQVVCSVMSKDCPGDGGELSDLSESSHASGDGFQDCADASDDGTGELSDGPDALVTAGVLPDTIVDDWLSLVHEGKRHAQRWKAKNAQALQQKAQALKQAKHWQASCQKERAKHMKLKKDYEELMKENNEYKVLHEKLGAWMSLGQSHFTKTSEEFHQNEVSPHYDEPGKALTDLQSPMATPPSTPPPMYLLRQFKSKPKARKGLCKKDGSPNTSFNRASVGGKMGKQAHPIGARHVQRPPPIGKGPM